MKILVFAYDLVVAGVTINAIELSAALRDRHGHDVVLYAAPGPLTCLAERHGLRLIEAPPAYRTVHPSPRRLRALRAVVARERPDVIYAWDWVQCVDALFGEHLVMGVPLVVTDMCNVLQRLLPRSIPTTFGTPELADRARAKGHREVRALVPPVDVKLNAPGAVSDREFRARHGLRDGDLNVVTVSRLDSSMKGESLVRTIEAMRRLGPESGLRLVIVGDGDARSTLEALARDVNRALGYESIVFTGELLDPRPAYAAADIVVGMGTSALRGMAFAKPVIVVGERGFCSTFGPATADWFLYNGLYGLGDGDPDNVRLTGQLHGLLQRRAELAELGRFSRRFVVEHFSLEVVSDQLSDFLVASVSRQPQRHVAALDSLRTAAIWIRERRFNRFGTPSRGWLLRLRGKRAAA